MCVHGVLPNHRSALTSIHCAYSFRLRARVLFTRASMPKVSKQKCLRAAISHAFSALAELSLPCLVKAKAVLRSRQKNQMVRHARWLSLSWNRRDLCDRIRGLLLARSLVASNFCRMIARRNNPFHDLPATKQLSAHCL